MKNLKLYALAALAASAFLVSCNKETVTDTPSVKTPISFVAFGEPQTKVTLDFSQAANVRWLDNDLIAVFDGTARNQFSIDTGTNTGESATFSGEVTAGATNLYAVSPYSAAVSQSGTNLTVTVPSSQTISSSTNVDPAALVQVGIVNNGSIEFKQVCGLLKITVSGDNVREIIVNGNAIAGTATVAAGNGEMSSRSSTSDSISLSYEGGANFPAGTYYAAVLPGTTSAGNFSIQLVNTYGATWVKTASSEVIFKRLKGLDAGNIDGSASFARHITNKDELFAWGQNMGKEHGVTVYIDNDIDCGSDPWLYSGAFDGILEGQNHKIYNFIAEQPAGACMFGSLTGSIKNLIIGSSDGSSWDNVSTFRHSATGATSGLYVAPVSLLADGAVMSGVINFAKIECTSESDSQAYLGGLVGHLGSSMAATITNCKNYGDIVNNSTYSGDGQSRMGGIMAQCNGTLTASDIKNYGDLTSTNGRNTFIGGLCGDLGAGSVISGTNVNEGNISVTGGSAVMFIGGCFGSIRGSVSSCTNKGAVSITSNTNNVFIGGVIGNLESQNLEIKDCINDGPVSINVVGRSFLGGIIGGCRTASVTGINISGCKNNASVTSVKGAADIGGITGQLWTSNTSAINIVISNCENTGTISSTFEENAGGNTNNLNIGGIFGQLDPDANSIHTVTGCKNSGTISSRGAMQSGRWVALAGIGAAGGKKITVSNCENTGNIVFTASSGTVNQTLYAGGIMAIFSTSSAARYITLDSCINRGEISSDRGTKPNFAGGIVGQTNDKGYGNVKDCVNYAAISVTSSLTTNRVGGVIGVNYCAASGNSNYGSVSDGSGNCSGAIAGQNSKALTGHKVCTSVTVNGTASVAAGATPDATWLCPNNTGSIACTVVAHSASE